MRLIGLMPCRNEDWILGLTARAALHWMDGLVILDHASTDETGRIAAELQQEYMGRRNVHVIDVPDPVWHEQAHRQMMLESAHELKATHIATIDADELLTGNLLPDIREMIEILSPGEVLQLPWIATTCHTFPGSFITDGVDPFVTVGWKDDSRFHWSDEIRNGYDYHRRHPFVKGGQSYQQFAFPLTPYADGGIMHLQFLSRRRLLAKHALYQMQEAIRWPGKYLGNPDPEATAKVRALYHHTVERLDHEMQACPAEWWAPYASLLKYMDPFTEPWQVAECKRLIEEHGRAKFEGLDLFGVV